MLQALICKKHQRPNEDGVSIWLKEDTLTACIFERLRYLPAQHIKGIFSSMHTYSKDTWLPDTLGCLQRVQFWPRFIHPDGGAVEPDVLFEFENLLLIIEAKRWDSVQQQYIGQWEREMVAVSHSHPDATKKPRRLLAIGGNPNQLSNEYVLSITWKDFVQTVKTCCHQPEQHIYALIESMENSLRIHGFDLRDPIYLVDYAVSISQCNMHKVQAYLTAMASDCSNCLVTFSATIGTRLRIDIKTIFNGVCHG